MGTKSFQLIFRVLSLTLFPLVLVVVFGTTKSVSCPSYLYYFLSWSLVLFVVANWIAWGVWGSILTLIFSFIIGTYSWLVADNVSCLFGIVPAVIIVLLLYNRHKLTKDAATGQYLKLDHLEREYNLLLQKYDKQKKLQGSFYKKIHHFMQLREIAKEAAFSLAPEAIKRQVISDLMQIIEAGDIYFLWEMSSDLQTLPLQVLESSKGISLTEAIRSDEFNLWTMRHRQPLLVKDIAKDYRFNAQRIIAKTKTRSLIMAPVTTGDTIMGIIRIDSFQQDTFSVDDLRMLAIIANIAALTIYNARLFQQTQYLADHDELTGLYVKRYFIEKLNSSIKEAQISGSAFTVLLLDLDKFKNLNDNYGHSVGDKVLQKVGRVLEESIPQRVSQPVVARYGGEEFVILLPNTARVDAKIIAEEMRKAIAGEAFIVRRQEIWTTVSTGVAEFLLNGNSAEAILASADAALYQAKREGRNKVVFAEVKK